MSDAQQQAIDAGFSKADVHATVLIASAFCMYNRYVEALGQPRLTDKLGDFEPYRDMGKYIAEHGYM